MAANLNEEDLDALTAENPGISTFMFLKLPDPMTVRVHISIKHSLVYPCFGGEDTVPD